MTGREGQWLSGEVFHWKVKETFQGGGCRAQIKHLLSGGREQLATESPVMLMFRRKNEYSDVCGRGKKKRKEKCSDLVLVRATRLEHIPSVKTFPLIVQSVLDCFLMKPPADFEIKSQRRLVMSC